MNFQKTTEEIKKHLPEYAEEHLEKSEFKDRAHLERRHLLHERLYKVLQVQMPAAYAQRKFHRERRKPALLDKRPVFLPQQEHAVRIHALFQGFI